MAIIEYLDDTRGLPYLVPRDDPLKRAQVRATSDIIVCGIQPIQNLAVLKYVGLERKAEWGKHWIESGFDGLEASLAKTAGRYSVGDDITMADLCLIPQVYNAKRFDVNVEAYPTISRVHDALSQLDAVKASHPQRQLDCPAELRA